MTSFVRQARRRLQHYGGFVKQQNPSRDLSKLSFWSKFYKQKITTGEPFDWFLSPETIVNTLPATDDDTIKNILHVGCGTSELGTILKQHYPTSKVINIDYDHICIDIMQRKHPHDIYIQYDIGEEKGNDTRISKEKFDLVVDKGTLDAVVFGGLEPTVEFLGGIEQLLSTPNGTLIQYTDDPPEYRQELLKCFFTTEEGWNVSVRTILEDGSETASSFNDGKEHYMYSIWRKA